MGDRNSTLKVDTDDSAPSTGAENASPTSVAENATNESRTSTSRPRNTIIKLNVGDKRFTTTQATLCSVPGSTLEAMFSGRHEFPAMRDEQDGSYFIDRDPTHFRHIINFLRVGAVVTLPTDAAAKEGLAIEADFFGLEALAQAIRMPKVDIAQQLPPDAFAMRQDENTLRNAFAEHKANGFDPYRGLLPLFCPDHGIQPLPITYERRTEEMYECMGSALRDKGPDGVPVTVDSLSQFQTNFNQEYPNILSRLAPVLIEEPVIVAGGAVLRALTASEGIRTAEWWGKTSDIDLFLYGNDLEEANRIARRVYYALAVDDEEWVIVRSRGVINIHLTAPFSPTQEKIQVVLRLYDSPAEVLLGFDCDCCCCAYDGSEVWLTPRCLLALRTGTNILNPLHAWPNKPSYELRLAKYAYRGFGVAIPGLERKSIDFERIIRSHLGDLRGLARLLKVTFEMESPPGDSSVAFPRMPKDIKTLRRKQINCCSSDEILVNGLIHDFYGEVGQVIIPRVFSSGPIAADWLEPLGFPRASETRDAAWEEIENAGEAAPEGVPSRLIHSWDRSKRSREYMNADMDSYDLDYLYYCQAYDGSDV